MEVPILGQHVPIPVDDLKRLKDLITQATQLAPQVSVAGLRAAKALTVAQEAAAQAEAVEQAIQEKVEKIVLSAGVKPEQFDGIDVEKGVINLKQETVEVG